VQIVYLEGGDRGLGNGGGGRSHTNIVITLRP